MRARLSFPAPGATRAVLVPSTMPKVATWRIVLLACALPMFAQCFQYMIDILPLYLLSKAWPLLVLPLFGWGLMRLDMPYKPLHIVVLGWILGVTPVISILQLGNDFAAALTTTAKVWSYSFAFSAAALLVLLRPPADALRRLVLWLGLGTYIVMVLLWFGVPASFYGGGDLVTKLFMYDPDRGYRIYMPMVFGVLVIFTLNRSFWMRPALWKLAAVVIAFALMLTIYKERAAIAAAMLTVAIGAALSMGRWRMAAFAVMGLAAGIVAVVLVQKMQAQAGLDHGLGNSLAVRQVSVATAWRYLSADPLRWLLGVGATTRFGDITLGRLFGNAMFFLADIGWLGVIFEYGVIGALLMLLLHLAGLRLAYGWARPDDPLSLALGDYILYLIIVSAVYSVVFTPGELTTVMALSYYLARYGAGVPQSSSPNPRHNAIARPRPSGRLALPAPSGMASSG